MKDTLAKIKELYEKYQISNQIGIATSLFMAIISYLPMYITYDLHQLAVTVFFLVIFVIRLTLFVWNRKVTGTEKEEREQAKMMLLSAIVLLMTHAVFLSALVYMMILKEDTPIFASVMLLMLVYGIYAFGKIILSVRCLIRNKRTNLYSETLAYIGWISAIYTLSIFTNYILIEEGAVNYVWPEYAMISVHGITIVILAVIMLVKSIRVLRKQKVF